MKFSADRTEKKGPLGGAYYETYIKITLTPEEENIANKQGIMSSRIFGSMRNSDDPETREAFSLCGRLEITIPLRRLHELPGYTGTCKKYVSTKFRRSLVDNAWIKKASFFYPRPKGDRTFFSISMKVRSLYFA